MSDRTWRWYRRTIDDILDDAQPVGALLEGDQLTEACVRARTVIRHRFHDAHDRVDQWDLPPWTGATL